MSHDSSKLNRYGKSPGSRRHARARSVVATTQRDASTHADDVRTILDGDVVPRCPSLERRPTRATRTSDDADATDACRRCGWSLRDDDEF